MRLVQFVKNNTHLVHMLVRLTVTGVPGFKNYVKRDTHN